MTRILRLWSLTVSPFFRPIMTQPLQGLGWGILSLNCTNRTFPPCAQPLDLWDMLSLPKRGNSSLRQREDRRDFKNRCRYYFNNINTNDFLFDRGYYLNIMVFRNLNEGGERASQTKIGWGEFMDIS